MQHFSNGSNGCSGYNQEKVIHRQGGWGVSSLEPIFCSEETIENSPAFQCRSRLKKTSSPAGTAETKQHFSRPCGTRLQYRQVPAFKRRAIFKMPLQDTRLSDRTKAGQAWGRSGRCHRRLKRILARGFGLFPARPGGGGNFGPAGGAHLAPGLGCCFGRFLCALDPGPAGARGGGNFGPAGGTHLPLLPLWSRTGCTLGGCCHDPTQLFLERRDFVLYVGSPT